MMRVIFLPFQDTQTLPNCALSIGNFDGVHCGHRALLRRLKEEAALRDLPASLLTFEPHSKNPFHKPPRLSTLRDKLTLLSQTQLLDRVFVCRFTQQFAALSAEAFVEDILVKKLKTRYLLIGEDFHFGAKRLGNVASLERYGNFTTEIMPTVRLHGERVSSSLVRLALARGNLSYAQQLLEQPYQITGKIAYGRQFGQTLGFPTANIYVASNKPALEGVFLVKTEGQFGKGYGVANLGKCPTVHRDMQYKLEVYLLNYSGNLYAQRMTVRFIKKLRDEKRFENIEALIAQIRQDVKQAAIYWNTNK